MTETISRLRPWGRHLELPAPKLVEAPTCPALPVRRWSTAGGWPAWWLVATHGGAGVTSLLRAGVGGQDGKGAWPQLATPPGESLAVPLVVLVARTSVSGLDSARKAARQHASGFTDEEFAAPPRLAGLVLVADAPGKLPKPLAQRIQLVEGAFARVWHVPWLEEWRLADRDAELPAPPILSDFTTEMQQLASSPSTSKEFVQ